MIIILLLAMTPFRADKVEISTEGETRIVHLIGNVVIEGEETVITCDRAAIDEETGSVTLSSSVKMQGRNGTVSSGSALYFFDEERGYMSDSVVLVSGDEVIRADSLYYEGLRDSVEMYGNVVIEDHDNDMTVAGQRGWYNLSKDEGSISGRPALRIMRQDKSPIEVNARLFSVKSKEDRFYGYDSVRARIDSIIVLCDTFAYDLKTDRGTMVRPVIQEENNELNGADGEFAMKQKTIDVLEVHGGRAVYYTENGSKNVVEGDTIRIIFKDGRAVSVRVEGSPHGVFSSSRRAENADD